MRKILSTGAYWDIQVNWTRLAAFDLFTVRKETNSVDIYYHWFIFTGFLWLFVGLIGSTHREAPTAAISHWIPLTELIIPPPPLKPFELNSRLKLRLHFGCVCLLTCLFVGLLACSVRLIGRGEKVRPNVTCVHWRFLRLNLIFFQLTLMDPFLSLSPSKPQLLNISPRRTKHTHTHTNTAGQWNKLRAEDCNHRLSSKPQTVSWKGERNDRVISVRAAFISRFLSWCFWFGCLWRFPG